MATMYPNKNTFRHSDDEENRDGRRVDSSNPSNMVNIQDSQEVYWPDLVSEAPAKSKTLTPRKRKLEDDTDIKEPGRKNLFRPHPIKQEPNDDPIRKMILIQSPIKEAPLENPPIADAQHEDKANIRKQLKQEAFDVPADESTIWPVRELLDSRRTKNRGFEYKIAWATPAQEVTWELLHCVLDSKHHIENYENRYPRRRRPAKQELRKAREVLDRIGLENMSK